MEMRVTTTDGTPVTLAVDVQALYAAPQGFVAKTPDLSDYPRLAPPKPLHVDDVLPQTSAPVLIAEGAIQPWVQLGGAWVSVSSLPAAQLHPPFPGNLKVAYKIYWDLQTVFTVAGPQNFQREIDYTQGSVVTESTAFSAELGVTAGSLSAKLTETTTHSVSISDQTTDKAVSTHQINAGTVAIIAFWQLVELYALVDPDGVLVTYDGYETVQVDIPIRGKVPVNIPISFPVSALVNRTPHLFDDRTDFSA